MPNARDVTSRYEVEVRHTCERLAVLRSVHQCDENRPVCVNCITAGLQCAFFVDEQSRTANAEILGPGSPPLSGSGTSTHTSTSGQHIDQGSRRPSPLPRSPPYLPQPPREPSPLDAADSDLRLDHLELLHHFCTVTFETLTPEPSQQQIWQSTVIKLGLSFPFLMQEILAIAALHLAHCKPQSQSRYYMKATELQCQALTGFQAIQKHVEASNCGAIMIFASLLALHVLADPSRRRGLNFSEYLDHFLSCINLMRGVRHVVITDWWPYLSESELKPLLHVQEPEQPYKIPDACRELAALTRNVKLGPASIKVYDEAIERLHWNFAASGVPLQKHSTIRWVLAWPAQLKDDYLELLNERRPEALVILAYFGVFLHSYQDSWAVGDSGAFLIKAINAHTGPHWRRWMAWPTQILESTGGTP